MFRTRHPLRSNDFDSYGHLNQSVYHALLEEARLEFAYSMLPRSFQFVIVRTELDYLREIPLGDREVELGISTLRVGNSSLQLVNKVWREDGELAADGVGSFVAWDPERRRSRPLTEAEREALLSATSDDEHAPSSARA